MLKIATIEDIDLVLSLALKFVEASPYKDFHDRATIYDFIFQVLNSDKTKHIILLHGEDGMLAGMASPFPYGNFNMATELAWWVNEDKRNTGVGKELIDAFEYWAKEIAGCKGITMASLDDDVGKYYLSRDYNLTERAYVKWLH